ncbi:tRNA lysidine(34) synthetase TilS [Alkalihalobacillus sp. NPDC078783]
MEESVHTFMKHTEMGIDGQHVVVAVSGGPDSMALLHFLYEERRRYRIRVTAAHINHQLRGEESEQDERLVKTYCEQAGIDFISQRVDVKRYAQKQRIGSSLAARELRYSQLERILDESKGDCLAVAHHGDDQIETVLMKFVRSANALQKPGMEAIRPFHQAKLIRPFLALSKSDIFTYCDENSIPYRIDSSNASSAYTRNRFRETILPFVTEENPNIHRHVQRYHEWQSDDQDFLNGLAEEAMLQVVHAKREQIVTISIDLFLSVALPLQRRMIHLILNYLYKGSARITSVHIEQTITMLGASNPSATLELADGLKVNREYNRCHFVRNEPNEQGQITKELKVPGKVVHSLGEVSATYVSQEEPSGPFEVLLDLDSIQLPLMIRAPLPGDRIDALGMDGTKKLNRLFIDRKLPKSLRSEWPIVTDADGYIIWVPYLQRSRIAVVTEETKNIVKLTFLRN